MAVSIGQALAVHWAVDGSLILVLPDLRRHPREPVSLTTGRSPEQRLALGLEEASAALTWLASMHAAFWLCTDQLPGEGGGAGLWDQVRSSSDGVRKGGGILYCSGAKLWEEGCWEQSLKGGPCVVGIDIGDAHSLELESTDAKGNAAHP